MLRCADFNTVFNAPLTLSTGEYSVRLIDEWPGGSGRLMNESSADRSLSGCGVVALTA